MDMSRLKHGILALSEGRVMQSVLNLLELLLHSCGIPMGIWRALVKEAGFALAFCICLPIFVLFCAIALLYTNQTLFGLPQALVLLFVILAGWAGLAKKTGFLVAICAYLPMLVLAGLVFFVSLARE